MFHVFRFLLQDFMEQGQTYRKDKKQAVTVVKKSFINTLCQEKTDTIMFSWKKEVKHFRKFHKNSPPATFSRFSQPKGES